MNSKRSCSVVFRELESFRNYKGLRIIFLKILDAILSLMKERWYTIVDKYLLRFSSIDTVIVCRVCCA